MSTYAEQGWAYAQRIADEQRAPRDAAWADGTRYMEAIRGARAMRDHAARDYDHPMLGGAFPFEREYGTLWFGRR